MGVVTKRTARMLCFNSAISRHELGVEAQRLVELCDDPKVTEAEKEQAMKKLDLMIDRLEKKVETRKRLQSGEPD
jgi:hypothetical protein